MMNDSPKPPRRVLVTGGNGSIGRRLSRAFADQGHQVAISSRGGTIDERSGASRAIALELGDPDGARAAVEEGVGDLGGLDTLVVNAVRWPQARAERFEDLPADEWRAGLRANVEGTFAVVQGALPALRRSRRGRIVLISSGVAEEGHPPTAHYAAAKAALGGLARTLAWDGGADGVLTNVVSVGFTRTERTGPFPQQLFDRAGELTPQRRVSTPEDVARVVLWLGSDANTSVTGEIVREGTSVARTPLVALA
jgi:3-oxoacyl-[acyl-carrier protein] reductase